MTESEQSPKPNGAPSEPPSDGTTPAVAPKISRPHRYKRSAETRARLAAGARQGWEKRRARAQGYQESPIVGVPTRVVLKPEDKERMEVVVVVEPPKTGNKWHDLPLVEALHQFSDLREELKKASEVITRRTDLLPKIATCWVALHHKDMPDLPGIHTAYERCVKRFPDGLAKFIDNCAVNSATGLVDPVYACSGTCHAVYQTYLQRLKMGLIKR